MRHALLPPSPLLSPAVSNWRCGKGSRRGAGNPEVLLGRGLGDSFEWNRADSSPVLGARSLLSVRRCSRRQVATRPGKVQAATSLPAASAEPRGGPGQLREPAALGRRKPRAFLSHVAQPGCRWSLGPDGEHRPLGPLFLYLRVSGRVGSGCHLLLLLPSLGAFSPKTGRTLFMAMCVGLQFLLC